MNVNEAEAVNQLLTALDPDLAPHIPNLLPDARLARHAARDLADRAYAVLDDGVRGTDISDDWYPRLDRVTARFAAADDRDDEAR